MATPAPKWRPPPTPTPLPLRRPGGDDARESLTNPDWRWRSFTNKYGYYEDSPRYTPPQRKDIDAFPKGPFEVTIFSTTERPWPEKAHIALFSRPLIQILEKYLPSIRELKSLAIPVIAGRELYLVLDSLKQHKAHVGGDCQVQSAAADQNVDEVVKSSDEVGKIEESPETQNLGVEARTPEHIEAEDEAFQPANANQVADAAVISSDVVRSSEDSPKSHNSSAEDPETAPKYTEVQSGDLQAAAVDQSADGAFFNRDGGTRSTKDSAKSHNTSAEETARKHTEEQSGDFQPAAPDQSADGAVTRSEVMHNIEDSPKSQNQSGKDTAPEDTEAQTVSDREFHENPSTGTEKPGTEAIDSTIKSCALTLNQRNEGEVPTDEVNWFAALCNRDQVTESSKPEAPLPVLTDEEIGLCHLKHLVRFLEEEYRDVPVTVRRMRQKKRVAWDMLWAFLPRGTRVVYYCGTSKEMVYARVSESYYDVTKKEKTKAKILVVKLDVWNYDGEHYRKCQTSREITKYTGEKSFSELAVCPDRILGTPKLSKEEFLTRGKMFHELVMKSTRRFMYYTGTMFYKLSGPQSGAHKSKADGRVMIDLASFAEMNLGYPMGNARPGTPANLFSKSRFCDDDSRAVSDDGLMASPAIVYGFSFALRRWGAFSLAGLREITFNKSAFEDLVLAQEKKTLIYNLVSQNGSESDGASISGSPELPLEQANPNTQQSEGCVILCYGLPGSGKSLTAESIAESLERPLWDVRLSDLRKEGFEEELVKIVDIAARWQAILLVNEADVFLQKRTAASGNPWITEMTAAFLRILDYNPGVMFLTTNQAGAMDEAFRDRISVFVRYNEVSAEDRRKLWRTLLTEGAVEGVTDEICGELATRDFSGREIKNTIRSARFWAKSIGEPVAAKHVKYMTELRTNSLKSLDEDFGTPALELNDFVHL